MAPDGSIIVLALVSLPLTSTSTPFSISTSTEATSNVSFVTEENRVHTCYECSFRQNHNLSEGDPRCMDPFNPDKSMDLLHECPNEHCKKTWVYLGSEEYSISRVCAPHCENYTWDANYFTMCCKTTNITGCNSAEATHQGINIWISLVVAITLYSFLQSIVSYALRM